MKNLVVVLGGGESGVGAALLAKSKGFEVFVSDKGRIKENFQEELKQAGIPYEEGQHTETRILEAVEVVKSPGIPDTVPLVRQLNEREIPVISEIEFASRYSTAKLIGLTGTNGKTTTSLLTFHLMKTAGLSVELAGNVGFSFARKVALGQEPKWFVLELSSFQLDGIVQFRPDIAVLLNITPDHLDRYGYQMQNYIRSKFRIVENQEGENVFLYNADDPNIIGYEGLERIKSQAIPISIQQIKNNRIQKAGFDFDIKLKGQHNAMNTAFAVEVALQAGVSPQHIQNGLDTFIGAPHRMELVGEWQGIEYINDSKGTNVDATFYALESMRRPTIWIAGGQDKGNDYSSLLPLVKKHVRVLVCLGIDNAKLVTTFGNLVDTIVETQSAEAAVEEARKLAVPGDTILLSPACASFDLFKNYEDRGDRFREAVKKLAASR